MESGRRNNQPSIQRIAELQLLISRFAQVERMPELPTADRRENDAEHSFGLALTVLFLAPRIAPELNLEAMLAYAIIHDIVEVEANDTFSFGTTEELASKEAREEAALAKLAEEWPDFPELIDYARGYKELRDEEAKFVYALDKMLPSILVNIGGKDEFWRRHKITAEMQREHKTKMSISPQLTEYQERLTQWLESTGSFYEPEANQQEQ